ncbi:hypothetical protein EZV62_026507 [Acer yangbiense]|uniref:non-specific serine/threonine protein kinase n=1 Tax=Acer yangbiense TaxID=1000413 RepID=A0A5C7GRH7_9ROSI|nr:hypothetical protein EZV62_026507 [Acer yangbiense]
MSKSHETSGYYCWMLIGVVTDTARPRNTVQTLIFMGCNRALCISVLFVTFDLFGSLHALETITGTQFLADDENRSLVSSDGNFKLGFFSPAKSQARYVGIWFNKISEQTVVWVANRETPIRNSSGIFKIGGDGNLAVFCCNQSSPLWSTNVSVPAQTSAAKLLDSGNLVLVAKETIIWQSFDYPTDTLLAGMKFGYNRKTGLNRILTSWKSIDDPTPGEFSLGYDLHSITQIFMYKNSVPHWRSGPWNGRLFNGLPDIGSRKDYFSDQNGFINITFVRNDNEIYTKFSPKKVDVFSIIVLESIGVVNRLIWHESQRWVKLQVILQGMCDEYMQCGANAICNEETLAHCACLPGFERLYPQDWYLKCQETKKEACGKGDGEGFVRLEGVKFPDARNSTLYSNMSLEECERECLKSCKCTGYANVYVDEMGRDCIAWYGELRDMRRYKSGQDFYLRVNAVELAADAQKNAKVHLLATKSTLVFIIVPLVVETLLAALCFYYLWRRNAKRNKGGGMHQSHLPKAQIVPQMTVMLIFGLLCTNCSANENSSVHFIADSENGSLVSSDGNFKLGFFSPGKSQARYVDTILPSMRFGLNWKTDLNHILTSWKSTDDPTPGEFSLRLDPHGIPQFFFVQKLRSGGPWNGHNLNGIPNVVTRRKGHKADYSDQIDLVNYTFVNNENESYYTFSSKNGPFFSILVLEPMGTLRRLIWHQSDEWSKFWMAPQDLCDEYNQCGANQICNNENSVHCACLPGFQPSYPQDLFLKCSGTRKTDGCGKGDGEGFVRLEAVKLPDARNSTLYSDINLKECERECLKSCNCMGYAILDVTGSEQGCITWYDKLRDIRLYKEGQDFYLRVDAVELAADARKNSKHFLATKSTLAFIIVPVVVEMLLAAVCFYYLWRRQVKRKGQKQKKQLGQSLYLDSARSSSTHKNSPNSSGQKYALDGVFSMKSDVFSFGVILLEIISGKKNRGFFHDDPYSNLIQYTWELWRDGKAPEIVDSCITDSCSSNELLRCIQVGLLCVQDNARDRPSMSTVVFMLCNETMLPSPKKSTFAIRKNEPDSSTTGTKCSINEVTITTFNVR